MLVINTQITDWISPRDGGGAPISGIAATLLANLVTENPAHATFPATITEEGVTGRYYIQFTPSTVGLWYWSTYSSAPLQIFDESYDVLSKPATVIVVPTDPTGATGAVASSELITRGDTKTWTLPLIDATGDPFDLTGCTVWFSVKQRFNLPDTDAVVSSSWTDGGASDGITVADPASGWISFGLTPAQSSELIASLYVADVQVLDTTAKVQTVWKLRLAVGAGTTERVSVP